MKRGKFIIVISLLSALVLTSSVNVISGQQTPSTITFKDFFDFLNQFSGSKNQSGLIDEYLVWQSTKGFPTIVNKTTAVFIFYSSANQLKEAKIAGDFNSWNPEAMNQLQSNFSFFYLVKHFEADARLDYKFVLGSNWVLDPRNPAKVPGGFGPNSELAMPDFVQPKEIKYYADIPHGTVESFDPKLSPNPSVQIYLPPAYNTSKRYDTAYFTDGSEYLSLGYAQNTLDYLIAHRNIQPIIGVFVDPSGSRTSWYNCSDTSYIHYLEKLVPVIDANFATNQSSTSRLHVGDSLGGQISAFVGIKLSNLFKRLGIQSGAFWDGASSSGLIGCNIKQQLSIAPKSLDLNVWLTAGTYEQTIYQDTKTVVDSIKQKGWVYNVSYYHEGHSWGLWRHTLADLLIHHFPNTVTNISVQPTTPSNSGIPTKSSSNNSFFSPLGLFLSIPVLISIKKKIRSYF